MVRTSRHPIAAFVLLAAFACGGSAAAPSTSPQPGATIHASPESPPVPASSTASPGLSPSAGGSGTPAGEFAVHVARPGGAIAAFGSIWVQSYVGGSLWRISPGGRVLAKLHGVSSNPVDGGRIGPLQSLASGFGSIWTLHRRGVVRIDPSTNRVIARIAVPVPVSIVAGMGAMWVAGAKSAIRLFRIEPTDDSIGSIPIRGPLASAAGIAAGEGTIWWINSSEASSVSAIDPVDGTQRYIPTPFYVSFVVPTADGVWLIGVDGQVAKIPAGSFMPNDRGRRAAQVIGVDHAGETIWLNTGDLVGVDASTAKVTSEHTVAGRPPPQVRAGVARLGPRVWVVDPAGDRIVGVRA